MPRSDRLNREELLDRQAFQLSLLDQLRAVHDPQEVLTIVSEAIGRKLGVARVGYADVSPGGAQVEVRSDWTQNVASLSGASFALDDFGKEAIADLRAGRTMIVTDATVDDRAAPHVENYIALEARSVVVAPLFREGYMTSLLFVHARDARVWSESDLGLIEDAALRTQATVERVLAEAALRASEQRYRSLFNSIDAGFCVIEVRFDAQGQAEDYRFLEVNDAFEQYTGIKNASGRWMREIASNHEQHWFDVYGRIALTGQPERFELPAHALGDRWYMVHAYRIDVPARRHVAILFTDLTDRKRTERALEEKSDELELATRAAHLGRFDYRPRTGSLVWDDRCREFFGLTPGAPIDYESAFLKGLHPDDRERTDKAVLAALDPSGSHDFNTEYRTVGIEDGKERHIAAYGMAFFDGEVAARLIGTVQDVTDDRRASALLRETEERLRLAARATNDAVWDWDLRFDQIRWNDSLERAYGHQLVDGVSDGQWWLDKIHPEDRSRISDSIHHVIDGEGLDWTDEYRFRRADGSYADVLDRGFVIRGPGNSPIRMIGAMLDLTTRKALERQLLRENIALEETVASATAERDRAEDALRQAQKMEAVGQLTGGLAHDFNNLLAGISGALEMMRLRVDQGRIGDLARYSAMAEESVHRAASLTHRLLAFSRRQTLDPRPTDVERLVRDMEELISRTVGPEIDLGLDLSEASWPVRVDPHQLENALLNLCINARDAMSEGGGILISAHARTLNEVAVEGHGVPPGDYVAIAVADAGSGMSQETLSRVFEPFFTTKPMGGGTGLGLSMIYGFAKQSAGFVEIESAVGEGTTVTIFLPRHLGEAAPIPRRARAELPVATVCGNILVVDDETSVRSLIADVVAEIGCKAIQAADAAQAMVEIESDKAFDLMVTDIGLPGEMNGRRLADAALKARPDLKIVFVTGYAEDALTENGDLPASMAVVTKPFAIGALAAKLRQMLDQP